MKKRLLPLLVLVIIFSITFSSLTKVEANSDVDNENESFEKTSETSNAYNTGFVKQNNYYSVFNEWLKEVSYGSFEYLIKASDLNGTLATDSKGYEEAIEVIAQDEISFELDVLEDGLYTINFDYYIFEDTKTKPTFEIRINDQLQYNELANINVPVTYEITGDVQYDRYGDELIPKSTIVSGWANTSLRDPGFFYDEPLYVNLSEGINKVTLKLNDSKVLLGDINVVGKVADEVTTTQTTGSYEQNLITIEAEDISYKNRQSIRTKYLRDPLVTPYEYKNRVLNVLDGYSFSEAGDEVTYEFEVLEAGLYNITFKYYQNANNGIDSTRRILIDGKLPSDELGSYLFDYSTKWQNETLGDDEAYQFYFDEGMHTLTLKIDNTGVRDYYHQLLDVLLDIDALSQTINKLTGGLEDQERNWKLDKYVPTINSDLNRIKNNIDKTIEDLSVYYDADDLSVLTHLTIASKNIEYFIEDPDRIPGRLDLFDDGEGSAYGRINTVLPILIYNPIHFDKIFIHQDVELPKANANVFTKTSEGVKAFFYSFFDPKYNEVSEVDEQTVEIWVNKSRLYVELMQRKFDEEFTPMTGINVQLSLLPDENKIVLSNAADTTPDGVIGVSHSRPFELAIRGVLEDLSLYEGFYDLNQQFDPSAFVSFIYDDGVYAIPETQDVKLLYVRDDIFSDLGIEVPDTWEDVVGILPVLNKHNMNFYNPLGGPNSYKSLGDTSPFIYQFGGLLYNETGTNTVINTGDSFDAFELMTDLYTVYNVPVQTSNFFEHFRNGKLPVGVSDANTYIQLKYAAPELAGQWSVYPIPGVYHEESDRVERWDPTYGTSSIIFKDSTKKEMTWDVIKWWSSTETQTDFSYDIQANLGSKFLYMTANIEGFKNGAWPSDSKDEVLEQWQWIQTTGKVPGDYMLERELSNAWNAVVLDGENIRVALDDAARTIDKELQRKLNEFGYMNETELLKPYKIPTIYNIQEWLSE
jgi:ABC-type glycerol-3-phosphate transport system substrate-binding protein